MLSFFPRDVLDEILILIESVSEGFPSYSWERFIRQCYIPNIKALGLAVSEEMLFKAIVDGRRTTDDARRLVGCFWLNRPLRQYFSLYRAVSQREGERKEK